MSRADELADFRNWFIDLGPPRQARVLARIGSWLTIAGRTSYGAGAMGDTEPGVLLRVNEAQHHILGQLSHLLEGEDRRYPDDVFADILIEHFTSVPIDFPLVMSDLRARA